LLIIRRQFIASPTGNKLPVGFHKNKKEFEMKGIFNFFIILILTFTLFGCFDKDSVGEPDTTTVTEVNVDDGSTDNNEGSDIVTVGDDNVAINDGAEPVSDHEINHMRQEAVQEIIYNLEQSRFGTPDSWISFREIKEQYPIMTDEYIKGIFIDHEDIFKGEGQLYMGPMEESPFLPTYGYERWFAHDISEWILIKGRRE